MTALLAKNPSSKTNECNAHDEEESRRLTLQRCNRELDQQSAIERVRWSLKNLPAQHRALVSVSTKTWVEVRATPGMLDIFSTVDCWR